MIPQETPSQHVYAPLVPGARFQVRCACGAAFDSAAKTVEAALAEIAGRHRCANVRLRGKAVDYAEHPVMQKTCPGCGEPYLNCECKDGG